MRTEPDPELREIGVLLHTARASAGISTECLSENTGYQRGFIQSVEAGIQTDRTSVLRFMTRLEHLLIARGALTHVTAIQRHRSVFDACTRRGGLNSAQQTAVKTSTL